jgi:non-ribosomal peptide synthetase component F
LLRRLVARILRDASKGVGIEGSSQSIIQLFEAVAKRLPDSIAATLGGASCTYVELNSQIDRLTTQMRRLGIKRGDRVGICAQRSISQVATVLSVLKVGGTTVPFDASYPALRLGFMLRDSHVGLVAMEWVDDPDR